MKILSPLLLFVLICTSGVFAQSAFPFKKTVEAKLYHRVVEDMTQVVVTLSIDKGWHLYHDDLGSKDGIGIPTKLAFKPASRAWSQPLFPKPHKLKQPGLGINGADTWVWSHEGEIRVYAQFKGETQEKIELTITGLTCEDGGSCIPYTDTITSLGRGDDTLFSAFPATISAVSVPRASVEVLEPVNTSAESVVWPAFTPQGDVAGHSLIIWILMAFIAGAFLNVMPCVLPVVSLKVLSLVEHAGKDRKAMFTHGLVFAAGILLVFAILATLAASLGLGWGEQFQQPSFMIGMIAVIFAFALSLFGLFELGVPAGVNGIASAQHEGYKDSFLKGILTTLLATPCSGPFLGGTLAWALSQSTLVIFTVFMSLGLGMALPYVLLTSQPKLLAFLPKPGMWMVSFKQITGFVLLLTVIYLMFSLPREMIIYTNFMLVSVGAAAWWYGKKAHFGVTLPKRIGATLTALAIAGGGAWVAFGPLYAMYEHEAEAGTHSLQWETFTPETFKQYQKEGRSVFVDFTANWCPNCKFNELRVYESDEIVTLFKEKNVVIMKADLTNDSKQTQEGRSLMRALGGRSIPFMALFPSDAPTQPHTRFDIVKRDDVADLIKSLPQP